MVAADRFPPLGNDPDHLVAFGQAGDGFVEKPHDFFGHRDFLTLNHHRVDQIELGLYRQDVLADRRFPLRNFPEHFPHLSFVQRHLDFGFFEGVLAELENIVPQFPVTGVRF